MATLFVSDLHLDAARPHAVESFSQFLCGPASRAQALYILGDLFETWVGDDEVGAVADRVRGDLLRLTSSGVPVWFMRGNRDFLVGPGFSSDTGVGLLPDPCVVSLHGQPTLLMHGDLLCTDDHEYLAFRAKVRDPAWREQFLAQPLERRNAFAGQARQASELRQSGLRDDGTLAAITDVNADAVEQTMRRFGVSRLLHGHTHRPAIHTIAGLGQRVVLGDWYEHGSVITVTDEGLELASL